MATELEAAAMAIFRLRQQRGHHGSILSEDLAKAAGAPDHLPRCNCGHLFEICNHPNCPEGTSPQPPAPAEGAPDVGELLNRLNMWLDNDYVRRCPDYIKSRSLDHAIGGAFDALTAQSASLAARAAEISTLKSDLKCETDRYAALVASDSETLTALVERIATLEAALRHVEEALVRDSRTAPVIEFIRAALSGKEPQQP